MSGYTRTDQSPGAYDTPPEVQRGLANEAWAPAESGEAS